MHTKGTWIPFRFQKCQYWETRKENYQFGRKLKWARLFQSLEKGLSLTLICKVKKCDRPWGNVSGFHQHASARLNRLCSRVLLVCFTTFTMAWYISDAHNIAERHFSAFYWFFLFCKTLKRKGFLIILYVQTQTLWYHQEHYSFLVECKREAISHADMNVTIRRHNMKDVIQY